MTEELKPKPLYYDALEKRIEELEKQQVEMLDVLDNFLVIMTSCHIDQDYIEATCDTAREMLRRSYLNKDREKENE